jgi:hypothetical protein
MPEPTKRIPRVCIDGRWFKCHSRQDLAFFGVRAVCDLSTSSQQPSKKLLLRRFARPGSSADADNRELLVELLTGAEPLGLRSPTQKEYHYATPNERGKYDDEVYHFTQQDVTGLVSLKQAILNAAASGPPKRVWKLFYSACEALNEYGKAVAAKGHEADPLAVQLVTLQCPSSLAVDEKTGRVIPLDAELQEPALPAADADFFFKWFDVQKRLPQAPVADASLLHSRALLLYFRYVLGYLREQPAPAGAVLPEMVLSQLAAIRPPDDLGDLLASLKNFTEDWSLAAEDAEAVAVPVGVRVPAVSRALSADPPPMPSNRPGCRWLFSFLCSLLLNVVFAVAVCVLGYPLWHTHTTAQSPPEDTGSADRGEKPPLVGAAPAVDPSLQFASYDVIFPVHGTSKQKVHDAILHLFPDRIVAPKQGAEERRRLLGAKLAAANESIKNADALAKLLDRLATDHQLRFKGYTPEAADRGIAAIIERGGLFTVTVEGSPTTHASLLKADGLELIARRAAIGKGGAVRSMLEDLRKATAEFASFEDALRIAGDRPAFLVRLEPTAKAHEEVRRQLLNREGTPVFVPRPLLELFDAVDPAADTGGGIARYTLKLEKKCFWRLVGKENRANVDFDNTPGKDKMRWREFDTEQTIAWGPISVSRVDGRTDVVATFDIAVILSDERVVVFRNQSIMVGDSRAQVLKQCRTYLEKVLHFNVQAIDDAVSVRNQGDQFTGAFLYSYLADQARQDNPIDNLQIMTREQFQAQRAAEDKVID